MATDEWVEVPKAKSYSKSAVAPEAVALALLKGPRGGCSTKIVIGAAVAAKLSWAVGTKLRLRWSTGGAPRLRLDVAPTGHPHGHELKANKAGNLILRSAALPEQLDRTPFTTRTLGHEVLVDRALPKMGELIIRLPIECYAVGKRHAA